METRAQRKKRENATCACPTSGSGKRQLKVVLKKLSKEDLQAYNVNILLFSVKYT